MHKSGYNQFIENSLNVNIYINNTDKQNICNKLKIILKKTNKLKKQLINKLSNKIINYFFIAHKLLNRNRVYSHVYMKKYKRYNIKLKYFKYSFFNKKKFFFH